MKKIEEMTKEEVLKEIRQFEDEKFNHNKRFVFVSYSHMDMDVVLKMVLEWIRDGYNIAIDLDFENHTSDTSWIDLMEKRLRSDLCVQVVCFRSSNYYYSYASLIEILLLRSDYLIDKRHGENAQIPIDIYTIANPIKIIDNDIDSAIYEKKYSEMKNNVGSGNKLFDKNEKEKNELKIGLETLCKKLDSKNKSKGNPDKIISDIEEKFNDTYIDYYNIIFSLFDAWFSVNDMNGNFKDLNYNPRPTFDKQKVYKITESQINDDTQEKVIVETNHTNNIENDKDESNNVDDTSGGSVEEQHNAKVKECVLKEIEKYKNEGKLVSVGNSKSMFTTKALNDYVKCSEFDNNKTTTGNLIGYIIGFYGLNKYSWSTFAFNLGVENIESKGIVKDRVISLIEARDKLNKDGTLENLLKEAKDKGLLVKVNYNNTFGKNSTNLLTIRYDDTSEDENVLIKNIDSALDWMEKFESNLLNVASKSK